MSSRLQLGSARPTSFATADGPVAALTAGAAGVPILLVPGYTGSKEDFAPLLDPLAAAGFAPFAIDLPGQYQSTGPSDSASYGSEPLGAIACEIAHSIGAPVHLLGHSFGGLVGRAATIRSPKSFSSLVLMDSGPAALQGLRRARIEQLAPLLATVGIAGVYAASEAASQAESGYLAPEPMMAEFLSRRFLAGSAAMLQGMGEALMTEPDRVDELANTLVPTLVIYGANDDAWPPSVQAAMAQRLSAAATVVIEYAAHSPAIENTAATVAALLAFWRNLS